MTRLGAACALVLALTAPAVAGAPLANRLGDESSDYLRSVAGSPVAWQPWGEAALALARELDRPILLSIGADWCHWCHVMDRETFAEPAVAAFVNAHFVPIKVDRDERPEIDARYQQMARAAFDTAGWPLTLFLAPDGRLLSGGASFTPDDRPGTPGLHTLLPRVVRAAHEPGAAVRTAQGLAQAADVTPVPSPLTPAFAANALAVALGEFDVVHAGFGHGGKEVPGPMLTLIARRHAETGEPRLREVLTRTLDAMARGAIRDQLGGGFFRGTTDRAWRVPDGTKPEVVQAQAVAAYLLGYQLTGEARYRTIAEETLAYVDRTLARREGGFHAAELKTSPGAPIDDTVYADRSALLASAYLEAYKVLGGEGRLRRALDALEFLQARMRQPDGLVAHAFREGRLIADGRLDDQFATAAAWLDAFEVTGAGRHLESARALVAAAVARFRAPDGAFLDVPGAPETRFADAGWPGGNGLAAIVLARLSALTNESSWLALARAALAVFPGAARALGPSLATYAYAVDLVTAGVPHVVVAGEEADARTRGLWRGALRAFRPGKIVERYDPRTSDLAAVPPAVAAVLRQQASLAEPRAYVCSGNVCSLPQSDPERLRELVETLGRRR